MRTTWASAGLGAALALLVGCGDDGYFLGGDGATECTAMASAHGISVVVAAEVVPVRDLRLEVCSDGECRDLRADLMAGSTTVDEGCSGDGPDDVCSARSEPDGTQVGFATVELPPGPVEVGARYRAGGRTVELDPVTVVMETAYPNGRECGADGTQGAVTVTADGLRS